MFFCTLHLETIVNDLNTPKLKKLIFVARHVSCIEDVQRSVADYSHSPYLGCCVCRGVLSN